MDELRSTPSRLFVTNQNKEEITNQFPSCIHQAYVQLLRKSLSPIPHSHPLKT